MLSPNGCARDLRNDEGSFWLEWKMPGVFRKFENAAFIATAANRDEIGLQVKIPILLKRLRF